MTAPPDPFSMTPAEAGARLAEMAAAASPAPPLAPTTAADARARLDVLTKDAAWTGRFMSGNVEARREFAELTAKVAGGDDVADALDGAPMSERLFETTMNGALSSRVVNEVVASMRELGISDGAIEEQLRDKPVTRSDRAATEAFRNMRHGDADWCKRLISGDAAAKREHILMCSILSREVTA